LDEPGIRPSIIGKGRLLEFWFLKSEFSKEDLFLIRSWKRALPKPTPKKVEQTIDGFREMTSVSIDCEINQYASEFISQWHDRFRPQRVPEPKVTLNPSASYDCKLSDGGKSVWFSERFEAFLGDPKVKHIQEPAEGSLEFMMEDGKTKLKDYRKYSLSFVFFHLRASGYLPGDPDEFAWVSNDPHERVSRILDEQVPPDGETPIYPSAVIPVLERGWKCRVLPRLPP
jgi:hypothetical protein